MIFNVGHLYVYMISMVPIIPFRHLAQYMGWALRLASYFTTDEPELRGKTSVAGDVQERGEIRN